MSKKRILITGNQGYIAKNLTKYLEAQGYVVGGFDKKLSVCAESFTLPKKPNLFAIIHLAAVAGINECENNIDDAIKNNIIASSNMFYLGYTHNIPVVFTSSQAAKTPQKSVYGSTKRYAECYAAYYNSLGANIRVLRLCNVYGGIDFLETKTSVVANFINAKLNNEHLIIHKHGEQTRDFIHVDDVCAAITLSLHNMRDIEDIIDIGTGTATSIRDLAEKISAKHVFSTADVGVESNKADTKKARDLLGFYTKHTLDNVVEQYC
jgi:nucleoside-diphosphate-sugar epimerase